MTRSDKMPEHELPEPIRTTLSGSTFGQRREDIFRRLQQSASQTSSNYSGKRELATESDEIVQQLCESLEETFSYGLRQNINLVAANIFQNMQEFVIGVSGGGGSSNNNDATFWDFCQAQLIPHERQRYDQLKQIWTKHGRGRAFIRTTLNEQRLRSHVLTWLDDPAQLHRYYTPWSLLLNDEVAKKLPEILESLSDVLFALSVDTTELNAPRRAPIVIDVKEEPIIYAPNPVPVVASKQNGRKNVVERPIIGASSTEDLLGAFTAKETLEVQQLTSRKAMEQQLLQDIQPIASPYTAPCEPIEPELEFLKTPLPDIPAVFSNSGDEDRSDTSSQYSKSSASAANSTAALEEQLCALTERCALLETRVAELSLQNRQLVRRLTVQFNESGVDPTSSFCSNFLITIPQVKLMKAQSTGSHYVYEIHITMRQRLEHWILFRRYREFYKLHKSLLRTHPSVASVEFPPKKHFGNMNLVFVEERRQQLQIYLLNLVESLPQVEACKSKAELQKAFPFFRER